MKNVENLGAVETVTLSITLPEMQWAVIQGRLEDNGWQRELAKAIDDAVFPPREG